MNAGKIRSDTEKCKNNLKRKNAAKDLPPDSKPEKPRSVNKHGKLTTGNRHRNCTVPELYETRYSKIARDGFVNSGTPLAKKANGFGEQMNEKFDQSRLTTIIRDSHDAVSVLDQNGAIKAWNKGAERIYGYSASEALGMTVFDLTPPRLRKQTADLLNAIQSGIPIKPIETKRIAKDGCIHDILLTLSRLTRDGKVAYIASTERDITEQNRWLSSIKELPRRIILAQEKERSRISQEIHSDFGQSLIALKMFVAVTSSQLSKKEPHLRPIFNNIKNQLTDIIDKARDLSHKLAPSSLKYVGLIGAIKKLIESMDLSRKMKVRFFHRNMGEADFESKDIIIYRIIQEATNNILKHAKATEMWIYAQCRNSMVRLEIGDNGRGFNPARRKRNRGLGLDLIREQALLIHGALDIESVPGKGTSIKIAIPIKVRKK